ncbi:MAG: hypothetical protein AAGN46_07370 [Acidobacteriota bacterium]
MVDKFIATLSPVKERLLRSVATHRDGKHPIRLCMAVTDVETGAIGYLTERGTLLSPAKILDSESYDLSQLEEHVVGSIGTIEAERGTGEFPTMLISCALASGVDPGLFEPIRMTLSRAARAWAVGEQGAPGVRSIP